MKKTDIVYLTFFTEVEKLEFNNFDAHFLQFLFLLSENKNIRRQKNYPYLNNAVFLYQYKINKNEIRKDKIVKLLRLYMKFLGDYFITDIKYNFMAYTIINKVSQSSKAVTILDGTVIKTFNHE